MTSSPTRQGLRAGVGCADCPLSLHIPMGLTPHSAKPRSGCMVLGSDVHSMTYSLHREDPWAHLPQGLLICLEAQFLETGQLLPGPQRGSPKIQQILSAIGTLHCASSPDSSWVLPVHTSEPLLNLCPCLKVLCSFSPRPTPISLFRLTSGITSSRRPSWCSKLG